jgi:hypothetical protein
MVAMVAKPAVKQGAVGAVDIWDLAAAAAAAHIKKVELL